MEGLPPPLFNLLNPPAKLSFVKFLPVLSFEVLPFQECLMDSIAFMSGSLWPEKNRNYWWNCWPTWNIFHWDAEGHTGTYNGFPISAYLGYALLNLLLCVCLFASLSLTHFELFFTQMIGSILELSRHFSETKMVSVFSVL